MFVEEAASDTITFANEEFELPVQHRQNVGAESSDVVGNGEPPSLRRSSRAKKPSILEGTRLHYLILFI